MRAGMLRTGGTPELLSKRRASGRRNGEGVARTLPASSSRLGLASRGCGRAQTRSTMLAERHGLHAASRGVHARPGARACASCAGAAGSIASRSVVAQRWRPRAGRADGAGRRFSLEPSTFVGRGGVGVGRRLVRPERGRQLAADAPEGQNAGGAHPDSSQSLGAVAAHPPLPSAQEEEETEATVITSSSGFFLLTICVASVVVYIVAQALYHSLTSEISLSRALFKSATRLIAANGFKQLAFIVSTITLLRAGLEPVVKAVRLLLAGPEGLDQAAWERSTVFMVLREIYQPLEILLYIAATVAVVEHTLPALIAVPGAYVAHVMRTIMTLSFIITSARIILSIKTRALSSAALKLELSGEATKQRRIEAIDKLLTVLTVTVSIVLSLQSVGFDVNSLLAIGGIGGVALGLAGREVLENFFNGLVILSSSPFEPGDEVFFRPANTTIVEGIVVDVGWFRTQIRSFEREVWIVPNSVFSKIVVRNVTRKGREWRFFQQLLLTADSIRVVERIVNEIRQCIRQDARVIQRLHRRAFVNGFYPDRIEVYVSFYIDAINQDSYMAVRQDLMLRFVRTAEECGGRLAYQQLAVDVGTQAGVTAAPSMLGGAQVLAQGAGMVDMGDTPVRGGPGRWGGPGGLGGGGVAAPVPDSDWSDIAPSTVSQATVIASAAGFGKKPFKASPEDDGADEAHEASKEKARGDARERGRGEARSSGTSTGNVVEEEEEEVHAISHPPPPEERARRARESAEAARNGSGRGAGENGAQGEAQGSNGTVVVEPEVAPGSETESDEEEEKRKARVFQDVDVDAEKKQ
ncbi:unnamed protein product [Pedinophyceae sp. YPF-701]|nr:unnamed protein product [Pedinophyceae sp. YPF-701]